MEEGNSLNFLQDILENEYGKDLKNTIIDGYKTKRATTFRANTLKTNSKIVEKYLNDHTMKYKKVRWSDDAFILIDNNENDVRSLDIYEKGEIYMQSLSSMLPAIILDPKSDENILDMTAAPGGKTTQLVALSDGKACITACEKNKIRMQRMKFNIEKQGATRANIMNEDARKLDDFFSFDKILLDAPCSGSGTLNFNDKDLQTKFTKDLVNRSIKTQKELLQKAVKILKKGGELVYSTCSILKEENEKNLEQLIKNNKLELIPINKDLFAEIPLLPVTLEGTICVCPNELYEGFFVAKLRKK